jgi:hypothetical protein
MKKDGACWGNKQRNKGLRRGVRSQKTRTYVRLDGLCYTGCTGGPKPPTTGEREVMREPRPDEQHNLR